MNIGNDLRDEAWLEADADAFGRALDRLREFILGRCRDGHQPRAQELTELRVAERMVEEVGAQGDHDTHR